MPLYLLKRFWKSLLWAVLVAVVLLLPGEDMPQSRLIQFEHFDKVIHMLLFLILQWLLLRDNIERKPAGAAVFNLYVLTVMVCFYAASTEIMQLLLTDDRNASVYDFLADMAGVTMAIIAWNFSKLNKR